MAKSHFQFKKRQKELAKRKKKEEKQLRKQEKKAAELDEAVENDEMNEADETVIDGASSEESPQE